MHIVLPWFALSPVRSLRLLAGVGELFFQAMVVGTGNYAWINWIGALPCLSLLDDRFYRQFFPETGQPCQAATDAAETSHYSSCRQISRWARKICRAVVVALLVVFIAVKSAEPIKELFSPAPWIHNYDHYYFATAQGVFGFINTHRVTLSLEYTHDAVKQAANSKCVDKAGAILSDAGRDYSCAELTGLGVCEHSREDLRSIMAQNCPASCAVCQVQLFKSCGKHDTSCSQSEAIRWLPLEWKNLPGANVYQTPKFNSPFHYRLDWQVWIRTTASMEHYGTRALQQARADQAPGAALPATLPLQRMSVPDFIPTLVDKLLAGDDDAAMLLATPPAVLFRTGRPANDTRGRNGKSPGPASCPRRPPTAIKAQYFMQTFSDWPDLFNFNATGGLPFPAPAGPWWRRTALSNPIYYLGNKQQLQKAQVRRTLEARGWLLLCLAALSSHTAAAQLFYAPSSSGPDKLRHGWARPGRWCSGIGTLLLIAVHLAFMLLLLAIDYLPTGQLKQAASITSINSVSMQHVRTHLHSMLSSLLGVVGFDSELFNNDSNASVDLSPSDAYLLLAAFYISLFILFFLFFLLLTRRALPTRPLELFNPISSPLLISIGLTACISCLSFQAHALAWRLDRTLPFSVSDRGAFTVKSQVSSTTASLTIRSSDHYVMPIVADDATPCTADGLRRLSQCRSALPVFKFYYYSEASSDLRTAVPG
eukprot:g15411.t1